MLKNMNLRRKQLRVCVVPTETEASCIQDFVNKIDVDFLAITEEAGRDTAWWSNQDYPPPASLENIQDINGNYAGRAMCLWIPPPL